MSKPHVVQILPMYHAEGEVVLNELADVKKFDNFDEEEIIEYLHTTEVDGIILRAPARITANILDHCQSVKAISGAGVGLDNINIEYATEKGIRVLHAPKLNSHATAEHTVGLLLSVMKNVNQFDLETRKGNFEFRNGMYTFELRNKKVGLVGFGEIAQKVAHILVNGFDMKAMAYVRNITDFHQKAANSNQVELTTSLERVFGECDVVSLHIPLNKETYQLIDYSLLSKMKKNAVLINTARGAIINESDLVRVIEGNQIHGAGIDVFAEEPPCSNHPFYSLKQVTLTPHIGGISLEAARQTSTLIAKNLIRAINGEELDVIANLQQLSRK